MHIFHYCTIFDQVLTVNIDMTADQLVNHSKILSFITLYSLRAACVSPKLRNIFQGLDLYLNHRKIDIHIIYITDHSLQKRTLVYFNRVYRLVIMNF
jgi:hypothetical protein